MHELQIDSSKGTVPTEEVFPEIKDPIKRIGLIFRGIRFKNTLTQTEFAHGLDLIIQTFLRLKNAGFHDLVGNIDKAYLSVLLCEGHFQNSLAASQSAVEAYQLDGCPKDRSVALALNAICLFLDGQIKAAKSVEQSILIRDGKVAGYLSILKSLFLGKDPALPINHHLSGVPWNLNGAPKSNSVTGNLLKMTI